MAFMASKTAMCTMAIARLDRPGPTCSPKTRLSPGGIGGDLVPVVEPVHGARPGTPVLSEIAQVRSSSEAWPEDLTETAGESIGAGAPGQAEGERPQQECAACWSTHHGVVLFIELSRSHLSGIRHRTMRCRPP